MAQWERPPKLRDDLVVVQQETDGQTFFVLKDPITRRYFRLREPEYHLIRQFDGRTDCAAIAAAFREKFNLGVSADDVAQFAAMVDSLNFFEGIKADYATSARQFLTPASESLLSRILFVKLKAFDPQRLLAALLPIARPLFHPAAIVLMILFMLAGVATYSANFESFRFSPADLFNVVSLVIIVFSLAVIILLHEFAHALTCLYHGGQVREMGFLLLYLQPCFYTDLSDSWMFERKAQRLAVIWAGVFFQMVLFAVAVFGWRVTVIGTGINYFFWLTANVCLLNLLFNLNPLIKLDGYYFLSEWVDIPNLRTKSFAYLTHVMKRMIGVASDSPHANRRERRVYIWYMILAGLFSAFLFVVMAVIIYGLLVGNLGGFGFLLFLFLLVLMFKGPLIQGMKFAVSREVRNALTTKPRTIIITGVIIVALIIVLFFIPFPRQVGGDVAIQPYADYTITLYSGQGLLELTLREGGVERRFHTEHIQLSTGDLAVLQLTPLVQEGDQVHKDDTLAAIISSQVSTSLTAAQAELERLRGELALVKSPPKPEAVETAQAAVNAAQASVTQLEKDVERNRSLSEKKLISNQQLERSQSDLSIARSNLEEAKARLKLLQSPPKPEEVDILISKIASQEAQISYLTSQEAAQVITSPVNGTVTVLYRDNLLFKVADMSRVEAAIPVTDNYLQYIQPDAAVRLKVRTFSGDAFAGVVTHIASAADDMTVGDSRARFTVHAIVDNADGRLREGMSGYAKIACGRASLFTIILERIKAFIRVEFWSWW